MKFRRAEDRQIRLLVGSTGRQPPSTERTASPDRKLEWRAYQWLPGGEPQRRAPADLEHADTAVLLLDLHQEEPLLVAGASLRRLPRGKGGADLLQRAASGAAGWEQERSRIWRWLQLPDQLQAFAEQMSRADSVQEVCTLLCEGIVRMVGAYAAVPLLREDQSAPSFYSIDARLSASDRFQLSLPSHPRVWRPGVITAAEAKPDVGSPFADLAHLFADTGAASVAHVPMGESGVLLVVERRRERDFEPDDWMLLRSLASQAEGALRRVRSLDEVRMLSLTDPLTGLSNRRRLEVVMEHAWAAALRGKPLSLALIDLDDFKKVNDEHGHLAGDRLLQHVARVLQEEARGTDLVVRYGGDEFLVLLPGETGRGAAALVGRVQIRLADRVAFSAGIAEYREGIASADELIARADRQLYAVKRQLRAHPE